jgi:hypothetical protein
MKNPTPCLSRFKFLPPGLVVWLLITTCLQARFVEHKELFYEAARKLLDHKRADGRTVGVKMLAGVPLDDFHLQF